MQEARELAGLIGGTGFDRLLETRARVEQILQVVIGDDGVLVQDFSGRIAYANEPAARMLGVATVADLLRIAPRELLSDLRLRDEHTGTVLGELPGTAVLRGEPASERDLEARHAGGELRWITVRTLPMSDRAGRIAASVTVLRDVTEQRRAAAFREKVLAIVSHDLRTPLTAISVTAALLGRRAKTVAPWLGEAALRIQNAAERATRLVHDLLDLTHTRLGSGMPIEPQPFDLATLTAEAIEELRSAHPTRTIHLHYRDSCVVAWDPDRIRQVLTNLLSNALTYSPIRSTVHVEIAVDAKTAAIAVRNYGPPIAPEKMATLFEPFVRGVRLSAERSVGLGLYIVKEIVTAHRGSIDVESTAEYGTAFTIRLPRQ